MAEAVVVWWNNKGRIWMAVIVYARDEADARRKGAGIFKSLIDDDQSIFASAYNTSAVWWKDEDPEQYQEYVAIGRKTRSLYEKRRDQKNAVRTIEKLKKKINPLPAFKPRRSLKRSTHPAQGSLF